MSARGSVAEPAIEFIGVTKRYRRSEAGVFELSFVVPRGDVFGFLGPNGAGKTTTIRLLLDLLRADQGVIRVFGLDTHSDAVAVHRRVGYLPGDLALYERFTSGEVLRHFAALRGGVDWTEVQRLAERFEVRLDQQVRSMSKGNRQKVGLVQALMSGPDLLVLDEPTSGLDPLVQRQVHQELRSRAAAGCTVLLSSHVLSEVSSVADRVGIIRAGRIVAIDDVDALRARAVHTLQARFGAPPPPGAFDAVPGIRAVQIDGATVRMELGGDMDGVVKALADFQVHDLIVAEPSLEDVFLGYYRPESL